MFFASCGSSPETSSTPSPPPSPTAPNTPPASPSPKSESPPSPEEAAIQSTVRGFYTALGTGDYGKAYSYYGPTTRRKTSKQTFTDDWERGQRNSKDPVTGMTINSLSIDNVSVPKAMVTADVSKQYRSGSTDSVHLIETWILVKEDGQWKLDSLFSKEQKVQE